MEVLSLCPFRAGALAWQSAPNAWSLTVVVKATFTIVDGAEATLAPVQAPVAAFTGEEATVEDLSPLKPKVDVLVLRCRNEDVATVEISSSVLAARGPIPPHAPMRRLILNDASLEWAAAVLRGEAVTAGPAPVGFDFNFFHVAPRDQRIDLLRTGVPLVLNNVLPSQTRVETILPSRKPQAFRIHPQTGKASEIILRCDTLCIDAVRNALTLTFRGISDIATGDLRDMGTIVVAAHSAGKKIRGDRIERFLRNGEPIEGDAQDGRHPLEKRYDTVLAAPKGDTVALPDMEGGGSEVWPAAPLQQNDSGMFRAGGGLPFQAAPFDAPPPLVPPAPLHVPGGGRRHATLATPRDHERAPHMPFHGAPPPPVPEAHAPPPPPEGIFPPPPAFLPIAPAPELPPLIRPPPLLGSSFTRDEKTADLPPGHTQPVAEMDDKTVDFPPEVAAAARAEMSAPTTIVVAPSPVAPTPGLAGKAVAAPKPVVAAPVAPKPAPIAPKPAPIAPKPAAASKPAEVAAPKPVTPAAAKPVAPAAAKPTASGGIVPKPIVPKGPLKVPAPLGPKLKTDAPAKPHVAAPAIEKKLAPVAPAKPVSATGRVEKPGTVVAPKPIVVAAADKPIAAPAAVDKPIAAPAAVDKPIAAPATAVDKPAGPAKPMPLRPMTATLPFPGMIQLDAAVTAAIAASAKAPPAPTVTPIEPFDVAGALKLEECAALDAELRHRAAQRKTLLEKNKLSEEQWPFVQKHWLDAIARQTEVGERKLLLAYDAAYVAAQERLGINVGIDTYAKLQVAAERGTSAAVLKELGLEPTDQMRLGRVWTQKLADEPMRMRELAAAIEKARGG